MFEKLGLSLITILLTTPQTICAPVVTVSQNYFGAIFYLRNTRKPRHENPKQAPAEAISGSESFGCLL